MYLDKYLTKRAERKHFLNSLREKSIVSTPYGIGHIVTIHDKYVDVEIVENNGEIVIYGFINKNQIYPI